MPANTMEKLRASLASPGFNTVVGLLGVGVPVLGFLTKRADQRWLLISVGLAAILLSLVGLTHRPSLEGLPRPNARAMADRTFYGLVELEMLGRAKEWFRQLNDGYLSVYGSEVTKFYILLWRIIRESSSEPKRVLTLDLTVNPDILLTRSDYHAVNKRLLDAGGTVKRVFVCRRSDLLRESFGRSLAKVSKLYSAMGAELGLAVREDLAPELVVDFVLFGNAAVIVEEEQADVNYVHGRSTLYFRNVESYMAKFQEVWTRTSTPAAPVVLKRYLMTVETMDLGGGTWDAAKIEDALLRSAVS